MRFRDAAQRARTCRALLTMTFTKDEIDLWWNASGPTHLAINQLTKLYSPVHLHWCKGCQATARFVWSVWNDEGNFLFSEAFESWPEHAWATVAEFFAALADDADWVASGETEDDRAAGETSLDAWIREVETTHGWRSA